MDLISATPLFGSRLGEERPEVYTAKLNLNVCSNIRSIRTRRTVSGGATVQPVRASEADGHILTFEDDRRDKEALKMSFLSTMRSMLMEEG